MLFMSCAFAVFDYTIKNVTVSKKNDPESKLITSNLITKCDNSDAKVLPPGYRYQLQRQ